MVEFEGIEEKIVGIGEPIAFENKTDSSFDVGMGVVFHKSGIYEVSIVGRRIIVSKVTEPKIGKWLEASHDGCVSYSKAYAECSECGKKIHMGWKMNYCPNCGCRMTECEENEMPILENHKDET